MIKNVIWDWNGTIVDDAFLFVDVMNSVLVENRLPTISIDDYKQNFCFPIKKYWAKLGFRFKDNEFDILNSLFIKRYKEKIFLPKLHKDIVVVFKYLQNKNINQFIVSASEHSLLLQSVKHYNLLPFFVAVFGVNNLNALGKERLAEQLITKHHLNPLNCLIVGDTKYDHVVAKSVGCDFLLVSFGHFSKTRLLSISPNVVDNPLDIISSVDAKIKNGAI